MFNVSVLLLNDALNQCDATEQWRDQRNAALWCFYKTQNNVTTHVRYGMI